MGNDGVNNVHMSWGREWYNYCVGISNHSNVCTGLYILTFELAIVQQLGRCWKTFQMAVFLRLLLLLLHTFTTIKWTFADRVWKKNMANIWNLQVCSSSVCLPEDYNKMDLPPTEGPVIVNTTIILIDIFEVIVISKTSLGQHCLSFHTITIIAQPGPPWDLHPGPELVHQACLGRQ